MLYNLAQRGVKCVLFEKVRGSKEQPKHSMNAFPNFIMVVIPRVDRFAVVVDCMPYSIVGYCCWRCGAVRYTPPPPKPHPQWLVACVWMRFGDDTGSMSVQVLRNVQFYYCLD